ncbi:MAG: zinc ribbon domain-containing protein [candidate division Zixibacteria bacterium]
MPTYQYICKHCQHEFEEFQSIVEEPISKCPKCGEKPQRLITGGAGFLLKGSGFYTTDYRSASYKKDAANDKPPIPKTDTAKKSDTSAKKISKD